MNKGKNNIIYAEMIADYTTLGIRKTGRNKCEVFVEYLEPHYARFVDHICNLPEESFEMNDNAIAVFYEKDGNLKLKGVYDIEYHKFVVKDKTDKAYKEKFGENYKVKEKVG